MSVQRCPWTNYSDDALLAGAAGVLYEAVKFRRFPAEDAHAESKRCVPLKGVCFDALPSQRFCQNIFVLFRSLSPGMQPTAIIHGTTPPRRRLRRAFGHPICASKQTAPRSAHDENCKPLKLKRHRNHRFANIPKCRSGNCRGQPWGLYNAKFVI